MMARGARDGGARDGSCRAGMDGVRTGRLKACARVLEMAGKRGRGRTSWRSFVRRVKARRRRRAMRVVSEEGCALGMVCPCVCVLSDRVSCRQVLNPYVDDSDLREIECDPLQHRFGLLPHSSNEPEICYETVKESLEEHPRTNHWREIIWLQAKELLKSRISSNTSSFVITSSGL